MLRRAKGIAIIVAAAMVPLLMSPAPAHAQRVEVPGFVQHGVASWYGPGFHGRKTASGARFNQYEMTAAHRRLPLGTRVEVTNVRNGRSVEVLINDRGPFVGGRIIDLSKAAADRLGMRNAGTARVRVEVIN